MSVVAMTGSGPPPYRLRSSGSRWFWLLVLVPLVVVPGLCVPVLLGAADTPPVDLLAGAFLALSVLVLVLGPRGLVSARTWVVGYLIVQFPVRGMFLLSAPKERPPIYAETSPGLGLEAALGRALLQSLVGLGVLALVYLLVRPRASERRPLTFAADLRPPQAYGLLAVGGLLLLLEAGSSGDTGSGGGFIVSLPGLMASGAAAAVCYAFVQAPRRYLLLFAVAVAYTTARVAMLGSKMAVLAALAAFVISLTGRAKRERPGRSHVVRGLAVLLVAGLVGTYVFAVASGRSQDKGFVETLSEGAAAAVSRSYGADALMASNAYLEGGADQLHGETLVEIAYSWVPRAVWPEKPKSFSIRFGEDVFSFSPLAGHSFFAPSYSGEWVLNFGLIGLLVGWMLFGLVLAKVDAIGSIAHRMLWLVSVVHLVEGSLVAQLWLAAPFLLGGYLALQRPARAVPGG